MTTIRAFVGIPLPEDYQKQLERMAQWRGRLSSRTSWTRPGNWHVTLRFLGDVAEDHVPQVRHALSGVRFDAFEFRAGGCGTFPPKGTPRVVWVGVAQGGEELAGLARAVEEALTPVGFTPEARGFSPHLTVCRVKDAGRDPWSDMLSEFGKMEWPTVTVDRFVLWRSRLTPGGPRYAALSEYRATSV
ncbi:2'-5' RNA ligase [Desulfobaculum xiamenense]|uniref:RNA 2',3'-cyclic phosphodiesterase n=1 Tax=Desulfobaculum xiamenense TaxID=995050 RepID=A0A846QJ67_9BACT|nr:RNA 2',3'-cyclic phosphodiesterase [Desulfobaculum xiamenense]NJB68201.1 2'-5' RNA ligase [Desulfobaculum xiamenense]